jgi:23S rRNA (adenine2503-C2)-methyltransferase
MPSPADPLGLTPTEWEAVAESWKEPRYRGRQIFDALQRRGVTEYASMQQLPGALRGRLEAEMPLLLPQIARRDVAADGSAKYGLRLSDGALIEAVLMPGETRTAAVNEFEDARQISNFEFRNSNLPKSSASNSKLAIRNSKYTVCLSSQTGCAVDCAFCVTGRLGGGRNLSTGEILGELRAVLADAELGWEGLRVVFMGMGEPFLNPEGVLPALEILFEMISPRRVTVSTSGITAAFPLFGTPPQRPNLAVSLNAADDETRSRLMPINRTYPLPGLLAAMRAWPLEPRRRITVEYVLIAGMNDSVKDAAMLARHLSGLPVKVNVIPLNEDPDYLAGWKRPDEKTIDRFIERLAQARLTATVRRSKGPDARAACGQLKGRMEDPRRRPKAPAP